MQGEELHEVVIHVALCDADAVARARHAAFVAAVGEECRIEFDVCEYETGEQLLFAFDDGRIPDVVLVDAVMPGIGGVAAAQKLRDRGFIGAIVFVTRTDEFVFDAFDVGAFNYVLKGDGTDAERFAAVFASAVGHVRRRSRKYILINGISEHRNIAIDTIRFVESRKHICVAHYNRASECEFISSLQRIENVLLPYGFVRIHRSYLVNREFVERYTFQSCMLRDGTELPVGRQRYQSLKAAMEKGAAVEAD